MFQTLQNHVDLDFRLEPDGPVLVRSGVGTLDPAVAEMEFQRTHRDGRPTVFLAGSGLKGVLRAHGERLLRSADHFACDPNEHHERNHCFKAGLKAGLGSTTVERPFANQCAACFTFGSVHVAGRFHALDAYPTPDRWEATNRTESRTQVALDRKSQGPASGSGALFEVEVVTTGSFDVRVRGESFTLWQLGLLLQSLRDLDLGLVRVGGLKSRGMGAVRVCEPRLTFRTLDRSEGKLTGATLPPGSKHTFSLGAAESVTLPPSGAISEERRGLFRTVTVGTGAFDEVAEALIGGPLTTYLDRRQAS